MNRTVDALAHIGIVGGMFLACVFLMLLDRKAPAGRRQAAPFDE